MNYRTNAWAVLAALLAIVLSATAAKGAKARTAATILFDDVAGDAIQSDGFGAYSGSYKSRDGSFSMSTGEGSLFFDFSSNVNPDAVTPFGVASDSGFLSDVDMTVSVLNGDAGATWLATVQFDFVAPAPDGTGPTEWRLWMAIEVEAQDTSGDGQVDTYVLSRPAPDPFPFHANLAWRTDPVNDPQPGPRRGPRYKDDGWRAAGQFDMPWGAAIER
jgi:hypothetical protein